MLKPHINVAKPSELETLAVYQQDALEASQPLQQALRHLHSQAPNQYSVIYEGPEGPIDAELVWKAIGHLPCEQVQSAASAIIDLPLQPPANMTAAVQPQNQAAGPPSLGSQQPSSTAQAVPADKAPAKHSLANALAVSLVLHSMRILQSHVLPRASQSANEHAVAAFSEPALPKNQSGRAPALRSSGQPWTLHGEHVKAPVSAAPAMHAQQAPAAEPINPAAPAAPLPSPHEPSLLPGPQNVSASPLAPLPPLLPSAPCHHDGDPKTKHPPVPSASVPATPAHTVTAPPAQSATPIFPQVIDQHASDGNLCQAAMQPERVSDCSPPAMPSASGMRNGAAPMQRGVAILPCQPASSPPQTLPDLPDCPDCPAPAKRQRCSGSITLAPLDHQGAESGSSGSVSQQQPQLNSAASRGSITGHRPIAGEAAAAEAPAHLQRPPRRQGSRMGALQFRQVSSTTP